MEIRLLGPLEAVAGDGSVLPIGGGKQRALLAALALEAGQTLSVQRLVEELWGLDPPDTAPKMVQIGVSQLRRVLPAGTLATRPPGYLLAVPAETVDLARFERLVREGRALLAAGDAAAAAARLHDATALWRGPALAEFDEPFADLEAPRLAELRLAGTEERIEADLALGRHAALVAELEQLVARHPLRERARGQLMVALYRSGRQADALATFQDARRHLDEVGIDPSPALRELERRVLQQDPALEAPAAARIETARPTAPPAAAAANVVGRAPDLDSLQRHYEIAAAGRRRVVVVAGEAGAGKTTLVDSFLATTGDALVARGQCAEQHGVAEPYLPVLDALGRLGRSQVRADLRRILAEHAPTWLVQLPWLLEADAADDIHRRVVGATPARMLREAVEALDALAAERPLVLVLEDLHWSDPSTVDLLAAVARRDDAARLLVIATVRTSDAATAGRPVHATLAELAVRGSVTRLDLGELQAYDVDRYLALRLPGAGLAPAVAAELADRTGGNPLYIERTVEEWIDEGHVEQTGATWALRTTEDALVREIPSTVRQFVRSRLQATADDDRSLLEAAGVAGTTFAAALVARAVDRDPDDVEQRLDALARARVFIAPDGLDEWPDGTISARFAFAHDLYRETLYEDLPAGRRARLHADIGAVLEDGHRGIPPDLAATLANHFTRAGAFDRALPSIEVAATHALERLAPREAVELLESGVGMLDRLPAGSDRDAHEFALLALLGPALLATRSWADEHAATVLERTHELAQRLGDPALIERSTLKLATFLEVRGAYARAEVLLQDALDREAGTSASRATIDTHEMMACTLFHQAEFGRALDHAERGIRVSDGGHANRFTAAMGDSADVACHSWAGLSLWFLGRPDQALRQMEAALAIARSAAHVHAEATAHAHAAMLAQLRNEPERTRELAGSAVTHGVRAGYAYRTAMGLVLRGWARAAGGDHDGLDEMQHGIEIADTMGARMDRAYFLGLLAEVHLLRDELEEARTVLAGAFAAMPERRFFFAAELHRLYGGLMCRAGERDEGRAALAYAVELARAKASPALELRAGLDLGALMLEEGRPTEAAALVRRPFETFSEGYDTPDLEGAAGFLAAISASS
jgi:DNA-binding SARP family transcriptional activator